MNFIKDMQEELQTFNTNSGHLKTDSSEEKSTNSDFDLIDTLRLIRSENVGLRTFYDLLKIYKTPTKALEAIPELSSRIKRTKPYKIFSRQDGLEEIEKSKKYGAHIISIFDDNYPEQLRNIFDPPPILTIFGNLNLLKKRMLAIVGSRNASVNGCRAAYKFAQEMGDEKFIITSGLARGIDTAAHKGSLETGTIAVIAGGIDNIYPPENTDLYKDIAEKGAIISELPFATIPRSQNFPQRNRIISGISEATLVIEATLKSGSLITARYALEQNRDILAIPGFPFDPRCQGPNQLIRDGATLITSTQDILSAINSPYKNKNRLEEDLLEYSSSSETKISDDEVKEVRDILLEKLSYTPISIEQIANLCECSYISVIVAILELELSGKLLRYPGNKISLIYEDK